LAARHPLVIWAAKLVAKKAANVRPKKSIIVKWTNNEINLVLTAKSKLDLGS
jgi:hypothetical protein